jgi:Gpi18-like mannosyltransferase
MLYHVLISVLLVCEVMSASLPVQTEHWFETQQLNHFDSTDHRVFKQRYFEIDQYWNKPYGPILLYVQFLLIFIFIQLTFFCVDLWRVYVW